MNRILIVLALVLFGIISSDAQTKKSHPTSKEATIKKLRLAIEANPENLQAHIPFINTLYYKDSIAAVRQYKLWIERFPKSSIVPFVLGKKLYENRSPEAGIYLLKSVSINPKLAEAWSLLHGTAILSGNKSLANEYNANAMKADPKNPGYELSYIRSLYENDKYRADSMALDFARRYKDNAYGSAAFSALVDNEPDETIRLAYYELWHDKFTKLKLEGFRYEMSDYFNLLINSGYYEKALNLALKMDFEVVENRFEWRYKLKITKEFIIARKFLDQQMPDKAIEVLDKIVLHEKFSNTRIYADETLLLLRAETRNLINQTQNAYDELLVRYSAEPSFRVKKVLDFAAVKLGISPDSLTKDIWKLRDSNVVLVTDVKFQNFLTSDSLSISDLKGRVVLLTSWFPYCGSCIEEFKYFEPVIRKFNSTDIAYLGVNIQPKQDAYVLPFVKNSGYSFIPLHDNQAVDKGNIQGSGGAPDNYLIDQDGHIMKSKFYTLNKSNAESLEIWIKELIERKRNFEREQK